MQKMLQHLIIHFRSIMCQVVSYRRLKTKENFKVLGLKVLAVAYERWSLTRGSKHSDLTGKLLVCWKTGPRGEVVAYERWSQSQVRLKFIQGTQWKNYPSWRNYFFVTNLVYAYLCIDIMN